MFYITHLETIVNRIWNIPLKNKTKQSSQKHYHHEHKIKWKINIKIVYIKTLSLSMSAEIKYSLKHSVFILSILWVADWWSKVKLLMKWVINSALLEAGLTTSQVSLYTTHLNQLVSVQVQMLLAWASFEIDYASSSWGEPQGSTLGPFSFTFKTLSLSSVSWKYVIFNNMQMILCFIYSCCY